VQEGDGSGRIQCRRGQSMLVRRRQRRRRHQLLLLCFNESFSNMSDRDDSPSSWPSHAYTFRYVCLPIRTYHSHQSRLVVMKKIKKLKTGEPKFDKHPWSSLDDPLSIRNKRLAFDDASTKVSSSNIGVLMAAPLVFHATVDSPTTILSRHVKYKRCVRIQHILLFQSVGEQLGSA
jgi:hypothetical protein